MDSAHTSKTALFTEDRLMAASNKKQVKSK